MKNVTQKDTHRIAPILIGAAGGLAGLALRCWQLTKGADITGRLRAGHPTGTVLAVYCAIAVIAAALLIRPMEKRSGYAESFSSERVMLLASELGAAALVMSAVMSLMAERGAVQLVIGGLGILAGFCIAVTAAQRYRGVIPPVGLHIIPCVYLAARLILVFKQWSVDPVVQDYCYALFASIASMCATYHLGGFCLGQGQRRLTTFWCVAGGFFSLIASVGTPASQRLFYCGICLWCLANAWQLLED